MTKRKIVLWLGALALLAAVIGGAVLGAGHFLEAPAQIPAKADLLAALGGDNGARADKIGRAHV